MAICTMLDPRFKQYNFTGATIPDAVSANTILKSTFENLWASMPLAPVPAEATAPSATETPTAAAAAASPTAAAAAEDNTPAAAATAPADTALPTARPDNSMRLMLTGPAASTGSTSFADIFDRPMEDMEREMEDMEPPVENDLEKYLKIPQLPLKNPDGTPSDILAWWRLRDHSLPADPQTGRPEGLPHLARMARQYHGEPASSAGAERLFLAASRAHHDLKGAMEDNSLEHQLLALANTD